MRARLEADCWEEIHKNRAVITLIVQLFKGEGEGGNLIIAKVIRRVCKYIREGCCQQQNVSRPIMWTIHRTPPQVILMKK